MNKKIVFSFVLILLATGAKSQTLNYKMYIDSIRLRNADYAAEKLNIAIGQAELEAAHATDDPSISIEYGNNSDWSMAMGQSASVEISKTLPLGKQAARINVAKQQLKVSQAVFEDFWRNLNADATIDFYRALLAKELLHIDSQAYQNIAVLALSDSLKFVRGEISETVMMQSRQEHYRARQELNIRQTDYSNALMVIDERCGISAHGTRNVEGVLEVSDHLFSLQQLLDQALENRSDLVAAEATVMLAQQQSRLEIRERRPDVEMAIGVNYNTPVLNAEAPAPQFVGYSVGLSVPLPVTSVNSGVRRVGALRHQQAQLQSLSVRNSIQGEVTRAFHVYQASLKRVKTYNYSLIEKARQALEGQLVSYQRDCIPLQEVLTAQHTFNELRETYALYVYECMVALVELERSVGL